MPAEKKKMGRPPTDTEPVMIRMQPAMIAAVDEYRRTLEDLPTRPEVIRRILAEFLKRETSYEP
ncbi:hypothetical protein [Marivita sp. GX14005]|uniref:hypothetical protein n=1 Tax=Marivita sp. GX14005 TaxID=2942276 RepID=UPI002018ACFD|nr:hypothetical protein [Marivita sp. GX14005]MCL3882678.1 hypothetical protein [Marivita sp. GX14005]